MEVPPIEESYDRSLEQQSLVERYYTPRYCVDAGQVCGDDYCVLFHSNRICVLTLAPSHPLLAENKRVGKISYEVSPNVDRLTNTVSGKGKRGAQVLTPSSIIFFVECTDGSRYPIRSCVPGKLVEVNEQLIENPNLLVERPADQGYLAIVLPPIPASARYKQELLTHEQYQEHVKRRSDDS